MEHQTSNPKHQTILSSILNPQSAMAFSSTSGLIDPRSKIQDPRFTKHSLPVMSHAHDVIEVREKVFTALIGSAVYPLHPLYPLHPC